MIAFRILVQVALLWLLVGAARWTAVPDAFPIDGVMEWVFVFVLSFCILFSNYITRDNKN